jgi:hypothetical protein
LGKNKDPYVLMLTYMKRFKDFIVSFLPFKTFGAQALVVKGETVLLIKHTYIPGWYTIGGGVEKGEYRRRIEEYLEKTPVSHRW